MESVENTTTTRNITAQAEQNSGWWTARATNEELPPATARSLTSVTTQLRKIAADLLETPIDSIDLTVTTELPSEVQELVDHAETRQAEATTAQDEARDSLLSAANALKEAGWPIRDIASRLKLSSKTVTATVETTPSETEAA